MTIRQTARITRNGNSKAINLNHVLTQAHNLREGDFVEVKLKKIVCSDPKPGMLNDKSFGKMSGASKIYSQLSGRGSQ